MFGKLRILAALFALAPFGAHALCDLSMEARAGEVDDYVLNGQACLADVPDGYAFDEDFESRIVDRINEARRAEGLDPLSVRNELRDAARWHSLDMAANDYFAHMGLDKRIPATRIFAFDRTLLSSVQRENIAAVMGAVNWDTVVDRLHDGLMDSESHREAILADDVNQIAVGIVRKPDGIWLTELFVKKDGAFDSPVPLSISADALVTQPATLDGWEWSGLALRQKGKITDLKTRGGHTGRIPGKASGVYALTVRGEQPGPVPNSCRYMHFSGPRVKIVPDEGKSS
ncbi:MAG: CAP domain-containing protein [Henriciella sp.]|uniref:CAP domain-containing protein n=1 Tax=Henriciella sp. TaxID=1968823 RepID=UPI003C7475E9